MKVNNTFGYVRALPDGESRKVIFTASTAQKDRHGTILNQKNWSLDNFNRNGIIGYNHEVYGSMFGGSDPDDVIGRGRAFTENGELLVEIDFEPAEINEKADKIFRKVKHGTLNAVSVGFSPVGEGEFGKSEEARGAENETYYFAGQELLEVSVVNIPSNAEAVQKSLGEFVEGLSVSQRSTLTKALNKDDSNTKDGVDNSFKLSKEQEDEFNRIGEEMLQSLKQHDESDFDLSEYEYRNRELNLKLKQ